jgi:hypothetical protein
MATMNRVFPPWGWHCFDLSEEMLDIYQVYEWCLQNFGRLANNGLDGRWDCDYYRTLANDESRLMFCFRDADDAILFRMVWG